nr:MFS transporter [Chloroflexota bacterium]
MKQNSKPPLLNDMLRRFMAAMVLANIAGNMYGPLLALYLKSLHADVLQVGLFFTLSQIVPLALQILGGWVSDSLGRLRSIALGSMAGVLSYVGLILAPTWQWVLLGEGLAAMTRSLVAPSFGAFIAEQSAEQQRGRVFALTETIYGVVSVVGPPLGGWLADRYGFRVMLLCAGALYLVATLIRIGMARTAARGAESGPRALSVAGLRGNLGAMMALLLAGGVITWILLTDGVRDVVFSMSFTLMPLYLNDIGGLSIQQIGWLSSIFGVMSMIVNIPAGALADKKGDRVAIALGYILNFAGLMVFVKVNSFFGYAVSWALFGLGVGLMSPAYNSLISKAVPEKVRGTAFGLFNTSLGVVSLPAPAIGAQLWERVNPQFPFLIAGWVALAAVVPVWLKFKLPAGGLAATPVAVASDAAGEV